MADDTFQPLTVEEARQRVLVRDVEEHDVDALIAAVRAENDAEVQDLIERAERYMAELRDGAR